MSEIFKEFATKVHRSKDSIYYPPKKLISLDPGQTTGIAIFKDGILDYQDQLITKNLKQGFNVLKSILVGEDTMVVYEDYRVYGFKAESHSWSALHTPQLIGLIRTLCYLNNLRTFTQMASLAKGFCTDPKLKMWGLYAPGMKHARDAVRHGCFYLMFNNGKVQVED